MKFALLFSILGFVACTKLDGAAVPNDLGNDLAGLFDGPRVFLTVNAIASVDPKTKQFLNRMLEINWYNIELTAGNWIGVFTEDPNANPSAKPVLRLTPTEAQGSVKTRIRFDVIDYRVTPIPEDGCMGYWIAYFPASSGSLLTSSCLQVFPDWMKQMDATIHGKTLAEIMIPGTHDAAAWKTYEGTSDDLNMAITYSRNQEDSVYTQLIHGIRYFDLRIGHYPETPEKFWINHGEFKIRPLQPILEDVKEFVSEHQEVIILDIHNLPVGFSGPHDPAHLELITFLNEQIGGHLYMKRSGVNPKMSNFWNSGRTVYLTYPTEIPIAEDFEFLWPNVYHNWANTNKVAELHTYFTETLPQISCKGNLFSVMAELTPTVADIILQPELGLRGFAQLVNLQVTEWFRQESWYSSANIVATDFYLGNDIIQMAIIVNRNSATCF